MNPLDALLVPPTLVKRALDDLRDIASEIRAVRAEVRAARAGIELLDELLVGTKVAVEPLSAQIAHMELQLEGLAAEMAPIRNLEPIRRGIEPLEQSMVSVRESVDELEPMIADLDRKIREIDPKLDEMQESIEPIGDLAEKIPGNRRRRD
jgi:chromosome segregation ATPase